MSIEQIIVQFQKTSLLEWIAFFTALAQVILAYKNKAINFLFGFVSVCIYIYLFVQVKLYADATLNLYYAVMSIIGYFQWNHKSELVSIGPAKSQERRMAIFICCLSFIIAYLLLSQYTDSDVPYWDSGVVATAWAGTYLLVRRRLASWLWLSVSNLIAIPLYMYKEYIATSLLTVILLIMGILAYIQWRSRYQNSKCVSP
jgi:nicotinamide mononucleotide transporter